MLWRLCLFLCESKSTLFDLPKSEYNKETVVKIYLQHCSRTVQPKCLSVCSSFYRGQFPEPERVQGGSAQRLFVKNGAIPTLLSDNLVLLNQRLWVCFSICYWLFKWWSAEWCTLFLIDRFGHLTQARTDMVKLTTLLTVFIIALEAKFAVMERGITFPTRAWDVWPITTHWVNWPIRAQ